MTWQPKAPQIDRLRKLQTLPCHFVVSVLIKSTASPFCFVFLLHRKLTLTPYNQFSERTEDFWRLSFIWALNSLKHGDSLLWLRWAQCPGIQERMETVNILFVSQMTHHRRLFGNSPAFSLHRSATSVPFYGPRTLRKDRFVEIAFGQVTNEMFLSCKTRRWRLPAF